MVDRCRASKGMRLVLIRPRAYSYAVASAASQGPHHEPRQLRGNTDRPRPSDDGVYVGCDGKNSVVGISHPFRDPRSRPDRCKRRTRPDPKREEPHSSAGRNARAVQSAGVTQTARKAVSAPQ